MVRSSSESALRQLLIRIGLVEGYHLQPIAGLTGESWRILATGVDWLAREQSAGKWQLGVSRRRERKVLHSLGDNFLAPKVIFANKQWLILNWLQGNVLSDTEFAEVAQNGELAALLVKLHRQPLSGYRLNLPALFERYWPLIDRRRLSPRWLALQRSLLCQPAPGPLKIAPVHMDLHAGNLLQTVAGLVPIDWEYAADADIGLELAALLRGNAWSVPRQQAFLRDYATRQGYSLEQLTRQTHRWQHWVDYLMLLWFEVRWQQSGDETFLQWGEGARRRLGLN